VTWGLAPGFQGPAGAVGEWTECGARKICFYNQSLPVGFRYNSN